MNSTVLKILKTIASVSVAFISFTIIVIIAFYFYLSDGVEFNLNKSNQTLSSLTNRFELDFSKNSSIYFKAREENIDTYITGGFVRDAILSIKQPRNPRIQLVVMAGNEVKTATLAEIIKQQAGFLESDIDTGDAGWLLRTTDHQPVEIGRIIHPISKKHCYSGPGQNRRVLQVPRLPSSTRLLYSRFWPSWKPQ